MIDIAPSQGNLNLSTLVHICRQLCLDALVEEGDKNFDWRLSFQEFKDLLSDSFRPSSKGNKAPYPSKCSAQDKKSSIENILYKVFLRRRQVEILENSLKFQYNIGFELLKLKLYMRTVEIKIFRASIG